MGTFVAIEAKYHFPCVTKYRNRYRSYLREKNKNTDFRYEQAKARAFTELILYIECGIEEGTYLLRLTLFRPGFFYRLNVQGGGRQGTPLWSQEPLKLAQWNFAQ